MLRRKFSHGLALAGILAGSLALFGAQPAMPESADCVRLHKQIDDVTRNSQVAQFAVAADKQRGEMERTTSYARSIGCENKKFLFFGSEPPAQCSALNAQIERMRANLDDLSARSGGGSGGRGELMAHYRSECLGVADDQGRPQNFLEGLFGGGQNKNQDNPDIATAPLNPDQAPNEKVVSDGETAEGGSKAVCVKTCDGSFFPVSYTAYSGKFSTLEDICRAQCPNAEVTLFSYPASGDIEQAISSTGARYVDSPNALKFRTSFDPNCSCRRKGETWADALASAEAKLGHEASSDIIVTQQKADELSRPKIDPKAKPTPIPTPAATSALGVKPVPGTDINGVDTTLSEAAANLGHDTSGIASGNAHTGAHVGTDQGQWIEVVGPDGVKRKVRTIDPTL
jgi:hypothetical protein